MGPRNCSQARARHRRTKLAGIATSVHGCSTWTATAAGCVRVTLLQARAIRKIVSEDNEMHSTMEGAARVS